MIIPVVCFNCGKQIANIWPEYKARLQEELNKQNDNIVKTDKYEKTVAGHILDELNVTKYCCRRMLLSHVEIIDDI